MTYSTLGYFKRLLHEEGTRHWKGYAIAFAFMAGSALSQSYFAYIIKDVVNDVLVGKNASAISWVSGVIIFVSVLKGICTYGQQYFLSGVGNSIIAHIQKRIYGHLLRQGVGYFAESHSTHFLAQQSFIASAARSALDLTVNAVGRDLLQVLSLTAVMVSQDALLSGAALVIVPIALFGIRTLVRRVRKIMMTEFTSFSEIMRITSETAQGVRVVKAFALENYLYQRMSDAVMSFATAATRLARVSNRASPLMETLAGFAVSCVVIYGGYAVAYQDRTPGSIFAFITALLLALEPVKRLAKFNVDFNSQMVGVEMLYKFLDAPPQEPDDSDRPDLIVTRGDITFDKVDFAYRADDPVLEGLSFQAIGGHSTALIGPSGSGKSTTFSLLQRFYPPQSGAIYIDGQDIAGVNRSSLRRSIGFVSQDTFLFQGSIIDNVALGRPGASREEIIEACKAAHVDHFVIELPDGYDTQVGEHGMSLSGGQRQRVAIARAFLKNAPIVLLDEATSALDVVSELYVREGLQKLCAGRTVLIIAHRKESYAHADEVIAMEDGRIKKPETVALPA